MARWDGFCGPTYAAISTAIDAEDCINLYPELVESGQGKSRYALIGVPGLSTWKTCGSGPIRAMVSYQTGSGEYTDLVSGDTVYRIAPNGTATAATGTVSNTAGSSCYMAANRTQVLIVADGYAYIFDGSAVTQIADSDLSSFQGKFHGCGSLDGYFIMLAKDTGVSNDERFFFSALNDGTAWDPLDFGRLENDINRLVGMIIDHREFWIFGSQITQGFYNSGDVDTPIVPVSGGTIQRGTAAEQSIVKLADNLFWLDSTSDGAGVVVRAQGYEATRISHHALEASIAGQTISDAIAYGYQENGHSFYVLTFPTADVTWAYDVQTGMWHKRLSWDGAAYHRHIGRCHAVRGTGHIIGSRTDGKIYTQSSTLYDFDGSTMRKVRRTPHVSKENRRLKHSLLELDMQTGASANITLRYSDNKGTSWSTDRAISLNQKRIRWPKLGSSLDRIYEVEVSSAVAVRIAAAYLEVG